MSGSVLFFGKLKSLTETAQCPLPDPWVGLTLAEARAAAIQQWPNLVSALTVVGVRIAVNHQMIADEAAYIITPTDEIAFMPPLSGG